MYVAKIPLPVDGNMLSNQHNHLRHIPRDQQRLQYRRWVLAAAAPLCMPGGHHQAVDLLPGVLVVIRLLVVHLQVFSLIAADCFGNHSSHSFLQAR
jgi:hypothetical protein